MRSDIWPHGLLQYDLVNRAREMGFQDIVTIDDDLGRTASGFVERPGFERLVSELCTGEVGAVFCKKPHDWRAMVASGII